MGVWIRSQNKVVLIRTDNIWIDGEAIFANYVGDIHTWLGDYDSEAEAIQVLDMIQTHIVKIDDYHRTGCYEDWVDPVFQMPPAGFSEPEKKQVAKLEQDLDLYKEALRDSIARAEGADSMHDPKEVLVKSLESLTPGGSEFSNDPETKAWSESVKEVD